MLRLSGHLWSTARLATDAVSANPAVDQLIKQASVVVFMKGVPAAPKCGFSNAVVQILRMHNVQYEAHDVLQNDTLRQAIKEHTQWPTIPQVFIAGEFVGGCDILLQMHQSGELIEELKKVGIRSALLEKAAAAAETAKAKKDKDIAPPDSTSSKIENKSDNK